MSQDATCNGCGFQKRHCECGRKRNTSGDVVKYSNYSNWKDDMNPYSMTSPKMYQRDAESNKYFTEILPILNEEVQIWIERTASHTVKLTEYSRNHHIYGTKRTWSCHDSSRYCFICTLCDFVDILRSMAISFLNIYPKPPLYWAISISDSGQSSYRLSQTQT